MGISLKCDQISLCPFYSLDDNNNLVSLVYPLTPFTTYLVLLALGSQGLL